MPRAISGWTFLCCGWLPGLLIKVVPPSLAIIATTVLLHSRQWASIIYSLCVLLAALDVPNAIKQRSNCRIAMSLIVISVCMLVAFIYGAANLQADADVGCSDADNVDTCQSVNSASGAILIIIGIAEAIATGTIIFALPAIQVLIAEQVPRLGGACLSCCLPERCSRPPPEG